MYEKSIDATMLGSHAGYENSIIRDQLPKGDESAVFKDSKLYDSFDMNRNRADTIRSDAAVSIGLMDAKEASNDGVDKSGVISFAAPVESP